MELRNQKILIGAFISFFTILPLILFFYFTPIPWNELPAGIREAGLFFIGLLWAITMAIIAKADSFKFYIGERYTPEGEVTKGSKNEKIFYIIIIAFVLIFLFCFLGLFFFFTIMSQFPRP